MSFKVFMLILSVVISVSLSSCWSSTVNGIITTKGIFPKYGGFNPSLVESIASGAQMAVDECKNAFKWDRWNCPQLSFSRQNHQPSTKEKAYTDAIIVAGVIYAITKNCSRGEIPNCGCNPGSRDRKDGPLQDLRRASDWSWGGCSDDTRLGEEAVGDLLESNGKNGDAQAFFNYHNNRIGREVVRQGMVKRCRCHGVSGSCSLQTCWMQMAPFPEIARRLKERYRAAVKISYESGDGSPVGGNSGRQLVASKVQNLSPKKLIYLDKSINYCNPHNSSEWPGTKGRACSRTKKDATVTIAERKSCRNLCKTCGYRVRRQKKTVSYRCNCKFMWCCEVKCDTCTEIVEQFFCA